MSYEITGRPWESVGAECFQLITSIIFLLLMTTANSQCKAGGWFYEDNLIKHVNLFIFQSMGCPAK